MSELVLTYNYSKLIKIAINGHIIHEVAIDPPASYFQVCWAHDWSGDYESEEAAREDCMQICGYGRSVREVKPGDDGYKDPSPPRLVDMRYPIPTAALTDQQIISAFTALTPDANYILGVFTAGARFAERHHSIK
jgi:hypothetical protein